jgi:hypothetical protein
VPTDPIFPSVKHPVRAAVGKIACGDRYARRTSPRYVGRLIRFAFLAPVIVESIVEGRQPITLTAEALTRRIELPLSWSAQRAALNVE